MNVGGDSKKIMSYLEMLYSESMEYERESRSKQYKRRSDNKIKDFLELLRWKENIIIRSISELEVVEKKNPATFEYVLERRRAVNRTLNTEKQREKELKRKDIFVNV
jgi:hypothetical protein